MESMPSPNGIEQQNQTKAQQRCHRLVSMWKQHRHSKEPKLRKLENQKTFHQFSFQTCVRRRRLCGRFWVPKRDTVECLNVVRIRCDTNVQQSTDAQMWLFLLKSARSSTNSNFRFC